MKRKCICPACKTILAFDRTKYSTVKCPKCTHEASVADFEETGERTEKPIRSQSGKFYRPGKLELVDGEEMWLSPQRIITLERGINTLGRKSANLEVSVQLATSDTRMSRKHAKIEVKMTADSTFVHHLSDADSANGTYHNGDALEVEEVIILALGDTIRMGQTTFKFVE